VRSQLRGSIKTVNPVRFCLLNIALCLGGVTAFAEAIILSYQGSVSVSRYAAPNGAHSFILAGVL
jgi:hypothetical protein